MKLYRKKSSLKNFLKPIVHLPTCPLTRVPRQGAKSCKKRPSGAPGKKKFFRAKNFFFAKSKRSGDFLFFEKWSEILSTNYLTVYSKPKILILEIKIYIYKFLENINNGLIFWILGKFADFIFVFSSFCLTQKIYDLAINTTKKMNIEVHRTHACAYPAVLKNSYQHFTIHYYMNKEIKPLEDIK